MNAEANSYIPTSIQAQIGNDNLDETYTRISMLTWLKKYLNHTSIVISVNLFQLPHVTETQNLEAGTGIC